MAKSLYERLDFEDTEVPTGAEIIIGRCVSKLHKDITNKAISIARHRGAAIFSVDDVRKAAEILRLKGMPIPSK